MKQTELDLNRGSWGGRRTNSGKKRIHSKGVAHIERPKVLSRYPLHINLKINTYIQNKPCLEIFQESLKLSQRQGLRVLRFSIQSNHIHLLVEADDNGSLTTAMKAFLTSFAKRVNRLKGTSGCLIQERYHLHVLRSPREVINASNYIAFNETHHTGRPPMKGFSGTIDQPKSYLGQFVFRISLPSHPGHSQPP